LKYVTPSWGNPTPYSKTLINSGKYRETERARLKRETLIVYVGVYQ